MQICSIVQDREFFTYLGFTIYYIISGNRMMSVLLIFVLFFVGCYCYPHNRECVSAGVNVSARKTLLNQMQVLF